MASPAEWARGYARQAEADFRAWQATEENEDVYPCHRMLLLQMEFCKARLIAAGTPPGSSWICRKAKRTVNGRGSPRAIEFGDFSI